MCSVRKYMHYLTKRGLLLACKSYIKTYKYHSKWCQIRWKIYHLFSVNTVKRPLNQYNRQFVICEYCHWCATFFVTPASEDTIGDDSFKICPACNKDNSVSLIPLQKNEAYRISFEDKRGLDIQFLFPIFHIITHNAYSGQFWPKI